MVLGLLIVVVLLALIAGLLFLFRRAKAPTEAESEAEVEPEPEVSAAETAEEETSEELSAAEVEARLKDPEPLNPFSEPPVWASNVAAASDAAIAKAGGRGLVGIGKDVGSWIEFSIKGKERGFKFSELQLLYKSAQKLGLVQPDTLLVSTKVLDRCIQMLLWQSIQDRSLAHKDTEDFLYRLLRYRQGMEIGRHGARSGLTSTRSLTIGQILRIVVPHVGLFKSRVVLVTRDTLEIELPRGKAVPGGFNWKRTDIEVYFWRRDDAGYFFEGKILNAPDKTMTPTLQMSHSESLIRTQKRASIRSKVQQDAWLSPLRSPEDASERFEPGAGYLCRLMDISDSGAAILVRGKLDPGFMVKVQTILGGFPVAMCGEIKAANVHEEKQITVLHVEAIPLSKASRIRVLAYVLGLTRVDETKSARAKPAETTAPVTAPTVEPPPVEMAEAVNAPLPLDLEQLEESK